MLPGITSRMLKKLKKEDFGIIKGHIEIVRDSVKRKKDILEGKFEEIQKPRNEVDFLAKLVKASEKYADKKLLAVLLALEVDSRELLRSIGEESDLVKKLGHLKGASAKSISKSIEGELIMASIVEHQLGLLFDIRGLAVDSIILSSDLKKRALRILIEKSCANLDNLVHFIARIIFDEEVPHLAIVYNMLRLEEWEDIEGKIVEIKARFFDTEAHLL